MQVLGAKRKHLSGYSTATQGLHEGFVFGSEIIQVMRNSRGLVLRSFSTCRGQETPSAPAP